MVSLDEWTSGSIMDGIKHKHLGEFLPMYAETVCPGQ